MQPTVYIKDVKKPINRKTYKKDNTNKSSTFNSFEKQKSILAQVEVNIVFCLISDVWSEISAYETMPVTVVFTIEFVFQVSRHLLGGVHFLKRVSRGGQNVCLQFGTDISGFYHGFILSNFLHCRFN